MSDESPQQELERAAERAAVAMRAYFAANAMLVKARDAAVDAERALLAVLPSAGQIVKTRFGTVERKARPKPRRKPDKDGILNNLESLPEGLREQVTSEEYVKVWLSHLEPDVADRVRAAVAKVKEEGGSGADSGVEEKFPTIAEIEKWVPAGEIRDSLIDTPPAPRDEVLVDGLGLDAVKFGGGS